MLVSSLSPIRKDVSTDPSNYTEPTRLPDENVLSKGYSRNRGDPLEAANVSKCFGKRNRCAATVIAAAENSAHSLGPSVRFKFYIKVLRSLFGEFSRQLENALFFVAGIPPRGGLRRGYSLTIFSFEVSCCSETEKSFSERL